MIILALIFMVFSCLFLAWSRKRNLNKQREEMSKEEENENYSFKPNMNNLLLVKTSELVLGKQLGNGAFGIVYEGYYKPSDQNDTKIRVAIKVLSSCKSTDEKALIKLTDELINVLLLSCLLHLSFSITNLLIFNLILIV
jgi:serine/threonine protein kinase